MSVDARMFNSDKVSIFIKKEENIRKLHETIDNLLKGKKFDNIPSSLAYAKDNKSIETFDEKNLVTSKKPIMHPEKTDSNFNNSLEDTIKLYKSIGDRNADFLFHWIYNIYDNIYLPSIDPAYKEKLTLVKTKLGIFDVLVDDLADNVKLRDRQLLEDCMKIPWDNSQTNDDNKYLKVSKMIWDDCIYSIQEFERYNEFKDIFYFDMHQFMNCNRYSFLVNTQNTSNFTEDKVYLHHGVMVLTHCDLDLMCSPDFNYEELEKLRPILFWVQDFIHIGNMLSTYPREVEELDLSSPIISLALRKDLVKKNTLVDDPEYSLECLRPLVPVFEKRMRDDLNIISKHLKEIYTIDMEDFYKRLKNVGNEFITRKHYWKNYKIGKNEEAIKLF